MFTPTRCAAVLLPSGPARDFERKHLYILLTNPFGPAKQVLMVPICTVASMCDNACLISVGDYPFVKHESYVAYARCRIECANDLIRLVGSGRFIEKAPASEDLANRIAAGLSRSQFTKPFALEFYQGFERSMSGR